MTDPDKKSMTDARNFYGRRSGKKLRRGQIEHLRNSLPKISVRGVTHTENPSRNQIDLVDTFGKRCPVWLEIGFGSGEHLLHQAQQYPEINFIGCEPYINGVAVLVPRIAELGIKNIRIHPGDARDLMDVLPPASISRAFLLYPDPWPKKRHHRRRFVTPEHLVPLCQTLKPGTRFHLATDIADYVRQAVEELNPANGFRLTNEAPEDWHIPWDDWYRTRYEAKALREGRTPHYLIFQKLETA